MSGTGMPCSAYAMSIIFAEPDIKPAKIAKEVGAGLSPYSAKLECLGRRCLWLPASAGERLSIDELELLLLSLLLLEGEVLRLVLPLRRGALMPYGPGSELSPSESEYPYASSEGKVNSRAESRLGDAGALRLIKDC